MFFISQTYPLLEPFLPELSIAAMNFRATAKEITALFVEKYPSLGVRAARAFAEEGVRDNARGYYVARARSLRFEGTVLSTLILDDAMMNEDPALLDLADAEQMLLPPDAPQKLTVLHEGGHLGLDHNTGAIIDLIADIDVPLSERRAVLNERRSKAFEEDYGVPVDIETIERLQESICDLFCAVAFARKENFDTAFVLQVLGDARMRCLLPTLHGAIETGRDDAAEALNYYTTPLLDLARDEAFLQDVARTPKAGLLKLCTAFAVKSFAAMPDEFAAPPIEAFRMLLTYEGDAHAPGPALRAVLEKHHDTFDRIVRRFADANEPFASERPYPLSRHGDPANDPG